MKQRQRIERAVVPGSTDTTVESFSLTNDSGLSLEVWTWGATLVEVRLPDRNGHQRNTVLRLPRLDSYLDRAQNPYTGATVGRYCRCVRDGRLVLDGVTHQLDTNDGSHHVHGGREGFDRRVWSAEAGRDGDRLSVRLSLVSPDGDQGYPGAVSAECVYTIDAENRLTIDHRAVTTAPTVVGLTNHAFWNLAGAGTVDRHHLAVNARRYLPFDDDLIPLPGPPAGVGDGGVDLRRTRPIGTRRLDTFFVLDDAEWAAELAHEESGLAMRVTTDAPGVGVYTGDHHPRSRGGVCLETGAWPDAPNRADYPSVRLDPGEVYRSRTVHHFRTG